MLYFAATCISSLVNADVKQTVLLTESVLEGLHLAGLEVGLLLRRDSSTVVTADNHVQTIGLAVRRCD